MALFESTSLHKSTAYVFGCLILLENLTLSLACIMLLNGWTPLTVYQRTEYADIVVSGYVLEAFKETRSDSETYAAQIQLLTIYKGGDVVNTISPVLGNSKVYTVSNFGDKSMCYADVDVGSSYIFFLTVYRGRLSAKYDDIFGATAELTKDNEQQVLDYLGWHTWSEWSSCSAPCNGGTQTRSRTCTRQSESECEGSNSSSRRCNTFSCKGSSDLIDNFKMKRLPFGVYKHPNRSIAYLITPQAKLFVPVSTLYHVTFPRDFSLVLTTKLSPGFRGYLLTVNDIRGRQRIGIHFSTSIKFEYLDYHEGRITSLEFDVDATDNVWHHVAFSVKDDTVTLFYDCDDVMSRTLERSKTSTFGTNLMIAVGPYFPRNGQPFRGAIEQLVLSEDTTAAEKQCHQQFENVLKDGDNFQRRTDENDGKYVIVNEDKKHDRDDNDNIRQTTDTITDGATRSIEKKTTTSPGCPKQCENGGTCSHGVCRCLTGYHGDQCETPICTSGCQNGGQCVGPDLCACSLAYTGSTCETPVCEPECRNGGRCISPGKCSCPYGYLQPRCKPVCSMMCYNGGRCARHNVCRCKKGYTGKDCSTAICSKGCFNGGKCVAANKCACPRGFRGKRCQKAKCRPRCQNKGKCLAPGVCLCRHGYFGPLCQRFQCQKKCKNGGTCSGPNKCSCPAGFYGRRCQKVKCTISCLNGGRCRRNNQCKCPSGFQGHRCEQRTCKYEKYSVPYTLRYKRLVREEYVSRCGPWRWKTCVKTRLKYVTIARETYRTAYRCV
ncbi:uncharacterized protein LOC121385635 isoform X2 [Gigantopelta aegis]|uniref:uncharacterized protein LOC121385635 isoform X2 n=1 Tax=Gigantopelta aegis TaxID=1735272 RepID=UPI001B88988F|nr:uncharacterized protein LOC121385635 isoform X2 [Gigantopelta aegis]